MAEQEFTLPPAPHRIERRLHALHVAWYVAASTPIPASIKILTPAHWQLKSLTGPTSVWSPTRREMQAAKTKVKDMASTAKEKLKESTTSAEEKAEMATAHTRAEREITHQQAKAKKAEAKAELHREKAEHRAEAATHGIAHVPLTSHHHHHHRPVGTVPRTADTTYPITGVRPAGDKFF